jgi:hypothetical protein
MSWSATVHPPNTTRLSYLPGLQPISKTVALHPFAILSSVVAIVDGVSP